MIDLTEITEAMIIRNLQPNDVIVLSVPDHLLTMQYAHEMKLRLEDQLCCKVLIKSDAITLDHVEQSDAC